MNRKVTVLGGAGNVGAAVARAIADNDPADVVILDIADQKAAGVALDILESCSIVGSDGRVIGGADYSSSANSDVVVMALDVPRKPDMSCDDLRNGGFGIIKAVTEQIVRYSPDCIIVPVANALDAVCQAVYTVSGFPRERVIGMGGVLDAARMRAFIALETNVSVENIQAFVLGGHGDRMVPLPRYSTIAGIPMPDYPYFKQRPERIAAICRRAADGEAEITRLVGASAWCAPGAAVAEMVEAILKDKKKILPCSVYLKGEYGVHGQFLGVPVKLGASGVEQVIEITLTPEEDAAVKTSAARSRN